MSVMQVCATQAGQASEPKRQELKISRTEIYLKSINGWLSVARKKVFRFFTGCRACIFKTHHRIEALKQVKRLTFCFKITIKWNLTKSHATSLKSAKYKLI